MKALVLNNYGSPDALSLKEVDKPAIKDDEVLVRVHASCVNAGDYFALHGSPWLIRFTAGFPRPKDYVLGSDVAGRVEAVGARVTEFRPGAEGIIVPNSGHGGMSYVVKAFCCRRSCASRGVR